MHLFDNAPDGCNTFKLSNHSLTRPRVHLLCRQMHRGVCKKEDECELGPREGVKRRQNCEDFDFEHVSFYIGEQQTAAAAKWPIIGMPSSSSRSVASNGNIRPLRQNSELNEVMGEPVFSAVQNAAGFY